MKTETSLPPSRIPFFRRCGRCLFSRKMLYAVIILLTLVALFYAEENFRGARAWERYRKDAEARGVKLDYAAHIPPPIPDAENGANTPIIQSWFIRPKRDDTNAWAELRRRSTNQWPEIFSQAYSKHRRATPARQKNRDERHLTNFELWQRAFAVVRGPRGTKPEKFVETERNAEQQTKAALVILDELKIYQPVLEELRAASTKPRIRYPVDYKLDEPFTILLPHLGKIKSVVSTLSLQSCAELAAGKSDEAFKNVQLMFWLTESLRDEPFLINQLVRIACLQITVQAIWEGIAQHKWTDEQLKDIEARLGQFDFFSSIEMSMGAERAAGISTIEWIRKTGSFNMIMDPGDQNNAYNPAFSWIATRLAPRGWFRMEAANYGRMSEANLDGAVDLDRRTINVERLEANEHKFESERKGGFMAFAEHRIFGTMLLPVFRNVSRKFILAQNTAEEAALACALERHRLATGQLPETLDVLVPKFIARLPHDPINGLPLKYERTGETDFVLSSVGWIQRDSDGALPRTPPNRTDWVWRSAP